MEQPTWQITPLLGGAAAVSSHPGGRWTIVGDGGGIEGGSLDEVLCRALRTAERRSEDGGPALHRTSR